MQDGELAKKFWLGNIFPRSRFPMLKPWPKRCIGSLLMNEIGLQPL
jgi:hypothetical protein